jgi:hypothetical protein
MSSAVAKAPTRAEIERLESLGERFRMWQKRQGKSYFKMPSYLWDESFDLVPIFGGRRVARELGVGRDELLRRMNEAQQPIVASAPTRASVSDTSQAPELALPQIEFLDFEMDWPGTEASQPTPVDRPAVSTAPEPVSPAPAPSVPTNVAPTPDSALLSEEAVVEIVAADGAKLSIRIPVNHLMKASALVREFRSQS